MNKTTEDWEKAFESYFDLEKGKWWSRHLVKDPFGTVVNEYNKDIKAYFRKLFSQALKQAEEKTIEKAIKCLPEEVEVGFEAPPDPLGRWRDTPNRECLKHCDETYNYCIKTMRNNLNSLKEQ